LLQVFPKLPILSITERRIFWQEQERGELDGEVQKYIYFLEKESTTLLD
jgi:hypothetical protein